MLENDGKEKKRRNETQRDKVSLTETKTRLGDKMDPQNIKRTCVVEDDSCFHMEGKDVLQRL